LHVSLNQTVLCLRTENLLLGILFLAIVNNCSLNSSREISELQQHMHKASVFVFLASVFVFLAESPTMHLDLVT